MVSVGTYAEDKDGKDCMPTAFCEIKRKSGDVMNAESLVSARALARLRLG